MRNIVFIALLLICSPTLAQQRFHWELTGGPGSDGATVLETNTNGDILVGAGNILVRSTDLGKSWLQIPIPSNSSGLIGAAALTGARIVLLFSDGSLFRVEADGSSPLQLRSIGTQTVYPAQQLLCTDRTGALCLIQPPSSVYRSKDQGVTWDTIIVPHGEFLMDFAMDERNFYLTTESGIYLSADAGKTWRRALNGIETSAYGSIAAGNGGWVWAEKLQDFNGTSQGLKVSSDYGQTWNTNRNVLDNSHKLIVRKDGRVLAGGGDEMHFVNDTLDSRRDLPSYGHQFLPGLDSSGRWLGSTSGWGNLFYAVGDSMTWNTMSNPLSHITAVRRVFSGVYSTTGTWEYVYADSNWKLFSPYTLPLFQTNFYDGSLISSGGTGISCSKDTGKSFVNLFPAMPGGASQFAAASANTIYAASQGVFKSTNNGTTWTETNDNALTGNVTALSVDSSGTLFAACGKPLFVSRDGGDSWQTVTLPFSTSIFKIITNKQGTIALAMKGYYAMRSTDGGTTWTPVVLPSGVNVSDVLLTESSDMFISTDSGVWYLPSGSTKVYPANDGLGLLNITSLASDANGVIYAGTAGVGVVRGVGVPGTLDVASAPVRPTSSVYPNPATNFVEIAVPHSDNWKATLIDAVGREYRLPSTFSGTTAQIDLSSFANGGYQIAMTSGNERVASPVVIYR